MAERLSDAARRRLAATLAENVADTPSGSSPQEAALMVAGSLAGPVGGRLLSYSPKALAAALATLGITAPTEANQETPYDKTMRDLTTQQAAIRSAIDKMKAEREALIKNAEIEGKTGKGRNWQAAQKKVTDWDQEKGQDLQSREADLVSLTKRISAYEEENSPASVRKRNAETPTKELFPGATMATQGALAAGGLATSMAMRGRNLSRFNTEMSDLSKALGKADKAGNAAEAQAMTAQLRALDAAGPSKKGTLAPTIAGFELGAFAPTAADYYRSGGDPSSPLYKKAVQSVVGGEGIKQVLGYEIPGTDLAARMAMAGLLGAGASKIGNTAVDAAIGRTALPQSQMVRAGMPSPGGPGGPGGSGGPLPVGPGGAGQGGQQVLPPQPPQPPQPKSPGPSSSPPYSPEHSAVSRQYIDELLASGQQLPAGRQMAQELAPRYAADNLRPINSGQLSRQANLTKSAIDAGADPARIIGQPGFLAIPGAMIGASAMLPDDVRAAIVQELMQR